MSPNYVDGQFHNLEPTQHLSGDRSYLSAISRYLFQKPEHRTPSAALPMIKTNLKALDRNRDLIIWFGHSSAYLQLDGKRILIDPVFGGNASPFSFINEAFKGEYPYTAEDMPDIDYLVISHDHWDHLEYTTLTKLSPRIKTVICPLGVGAHLEHWGFSPLNIHEGDWNDTFKLEPDFTIHILPARHFSGRGLERNQTLWASFMLETSSRRVFYSGDSGYGKHFADIGRRFGKVDLAIMENGQYDPAWKNIHMMPEEVVQGAIDVHAKAVLPVHSGRFAMSRHPWDEPYIRITEASRDKNFQLMTPVIGRVVYLDDAGQTFYPWWNMPG